jgi:hypothetical protein
LFGQEYHSLPLLLKAVLRCKIFPSCNRFLTEQLCIIKSFMLSCYAVPFLSRQLSHLLQTSSFFLMEGQKGTFLLPTAYTTAKSLLCCQTNTLTVAEIQCRFSFVCVQIELQCARNVMWDCAFRVLQQYHRKARFS